MESNPTVLDSVKDNTKKEDQKMDQQDITSSENKDGVKKEVSKLKMDNDKKESQKEGNNNDTNKKENKAVKKENEKNERQKEQNDDDSENDESEDEIEMGLLDRPVEVTGCRARKQVERLEVSFALPTKDKQIPEGRGTRLGDCPRIEFQIAKHLVADLKPLHRILFNRQGTANDTKKNIRKFSGFPFEENSSEFEKNKAKCEKLSLLTLKKICEVLDLERSGTKDEIIMRILQFLVRPSDSGKPLPKKKSAGRDKKTSAKKKKSKSDNKKSKSKSSEEDEVEEEDDDDIEDEIAPSEGDEVSDASANEEKKEETSAATKKKSKAKSKKTLIKVKTMKDEKPKKGAKGLKRKKDASSSSDEDDEPIAKKCKLPDDDEIKNLVQTILEQANLNEVTMKKVIKQVYDTYPDCDLTDKKSLIKKTIKTVLQLNEKSEDR